MRTVLSVTIPLSVLELKKNAESEQAARELVEILLTEERFIWPEHQPLSQREIRSAFDAFEARYQDEPELPNDPDGRAITSFVREFLRLGAATHDSELGLDLDAPAALKYEGLRHAISILSQIPRAQRDMISDVDRVIEDRQSRVFGLVFQSGAVFTFRLRHHTPEELKQATERIASAFAPRPADELNDLLRKTASVYVAGVHQRFEPTFGVAEMKTPKGELTQVGDVHAIGSYGGLARYVAWRSTQRVLLVLAGLLLLLDLIVEIEVPPLDLGHMDLTSWTSGTLSRLTTAAFTAYLFAVLIEYMDLRKKFQSRGPSDALIDWNAP